MRHQVTNTFNKEKFIFLGLAAIAAVCVYNFLASRPVPLEVGIPVSPLPIPAPLAPEKPDPRKGDVVFYLQSGQYEGVAINRERNDPFAPIYVPTPADIAALATQVKQIPLIPAVQPPAPIDAPDPEKVARDIEREKAKKFALNEYKAKVDFSAVMALGGVTYGLLKDDAGNTMQVKVGDYLEDFKYTVAKIDKQAIWVTDENDRMYVARDLSFADNGTKSDGGDDEKPGKKVKNVASKGGPKTEAKADKPAAPVQSEAEAAMKLVGKMVDKMGNQNQILNPNAGGRKNRRGGN